MQFATPLYDFGRMKAGDPVKYTYLFTNTGDRLLLLNSVQPQCGCTTAGDWTKQVEPGQTGSIQQARGCGREVDQSQGDFQL